MDIRISFNKLEDSKSCEPNYPSLNKEYLLSGLTYKSNEILHKISEGPRNYPYELLLHTTKTFHFNQFEVIFFSHILNDVEPCYNTDPELFADELEITPILTKLLIKISQFFHHPTNHTNLIIKQKKVFDESHSDHSSEGEYPHRQSLTDIKKIYTYLLIIGYAVKYYLNEQTAIKPYDEEIKHRHPTFFVNYFNLWAKKYGSTALATTPRRINAYYLSLAAQLEQEDNFNSQEIDCQYRNYNEIVEELIKATTEGDDGELERDGNDNE